MTPDLHALVLDAIRIGEARPLGTLAALHACVPCDREHVVAAVWDLVEDGVLTYDASATVRRVA